MSTVERSTSESNGAGKGGIRVNDYATPESRLKGARRSAEVRAEAAKTLRQRFAEKLDEHADELFDSFQRAWRADDWKAADAAINQAHGKPDGRIEFNVSGQLEVEHTRRLTLADVAGLAAELTPASAQLGQGDEPASD